MNHISEEKRNLVLGSMIQILDEQRTHILKANQADIEQFVGEDRALYDRLKIDDNMIDGMLNSLKKVLEESDPIGKEIYTFEHPKGMKITNQTAPFGRVMIIYESRPDVTIEAAAIAFKSGNRILLKGGKEAIHSNLVLVNCWHKALTDNGISADWIRYLKMNRAETQSFLKTPDVPIDLIIPRGGSQLIAFVKQHAQCPVIVSGRGNNFVYVDENADLEMAERIILNAKLDKISACNALDKVLVHSSLLEKASFIQQLCEKLRQSDVQIYIELGLMAFVNNGIILDNEDIWYEEFLEYKIAIGVVEDLDQAIEKVNKYSGGHSCSIITKDDARANHFMTNVDAAAVYHNCSTRFTDGGEFGMGAEMAISTDKLHHRGPLGLEQLVSNKWLIFGKGEIR